MAGRLAIKHHPDKNPDDPLAEDRFKEIAIAYQTLSDDELRKKYNEFGPKESAPEGGYVDPEEVFGAIFGGDRFTPIIGQISLARDMKAALQEADEALEEGEMKRQKDAKGRDIISPEEKAKKDEKDRVKASEVSLASDPSKAKKDADGCRKRLFARRGSRNLWTTLSANLGYSPSRQQVLMTGMLHRVGGPSVN